MNDETLNSCSHPFWIVFSCDLRSDVSLFTAHKSDYLFQSHNHHNQQCSPMDGLKKQQRIEDDVILFTLTDVNLYFVLLKRCSQHDNTTGTHAG